MAYDFPPSPFTGQVYAGWTFDGEKWLSTTATPNTAGVIGIQVFTSSGIYVPTASMTTCVLEAVGGGGGGGGATSTANSVYSGGGGGAGGYSRKLATAAQIGASQNVTIGAGGAGAASGSNPGSPGTDTSVGALCIAKGAVGGTFGNSVQFGIGGAGGVAGIGDLTTVGAVGGSGMYNSINTTLAVPSGAGAPSMFGGGAVGATSTGNAAPGYGAGGSGGYATGTSIPSSGGGAGKSGLIVITEYGMTALASTAGQGNVRYDLPQGLSLSQKAQARANIDSLKKNYIINGAMMVSQENGTVAGFVAQYYPVDQFFSNFANAGNLGIAQIATVTPSGSPNRINTLVNTADAAVAVGDYQAITTKIEGLRLVDLLFGTTTAKTVTLQFGVRAPAGTYCVGINNGIFDRSYVAEYVIAAGEANIDVLKSVTFTGDVTGTWAKDTTAGIVIFFTLMAGTNFQTPANSWIAGNKFGTANQFNFMGGAGNVFQLFDVGLYEGTTAPAFQVPDYASEFILCQRYWQRHGVVVDTVTAWQSWAYPVQMRITPIATGGGAGFAAGAGNGPDIAAFSQTARAVQTLSFSARL